MNPTIGDIALETVESKNSGLSRPDVKSSFERVPGVDFFGLEPGSGLG